LFRLSGPCPSGEVLREERLGPAVGQPRAFFIAPQAHLGGKAVVQPRVVVDRHMWVGVQPFMHRLLLLGRDEAIGHRHVEQQRPGDRMAFVQHVGNADAVVAHRRIDVGPRRRLVGHLAAHAVADEADLGHARLAPDPANGRLDVANAGIEIMPAKQAERPLELFGYIGIQLDPFHLPPEHVGGDGEISLAGEMVGLLADAGVHPEDLGDDDDCSLRRARGPRHIGREIPVAFVGCDAHIFTHFSLSARFPVQPAGLPVRWTLPRPCASLAGMRKGG